MSRRQLSASLVIAMATLTVLTGCSGAADEPEPRFVTTEESQLLAIARFNNFDAGTRAVTATLTDQGHDLSLTGWMDYRTGAGYVSLTVDDSPNSLLLWETHTLAAHAPIEPIPLPAPDTNDGLGDTWTTGPIDPTVSNLHTVLILITELGLDRPENPLLLQQGGVLWLGTDIVGDTAVTIFSGPTGLDGDGESRLRYWVDDTGIMHRAEILLGTEWATVTFGDDEDVSLPYSVGPLTE